MVVLHHKLILFVMNALVITYNHMKNSLILFYPDEGLTASGRKRSIFITICFVVKQKTFNMSIDAAKLLILSIF